MTTKNDNREYWDEDIDKDGNTIREANIEAMIAKLLDDGVLFANSREWICPITGEKNPPTIVLFVNCNDVFAWGCADAESITDVEIEHLFEELQKDPKFGSEKWVCKKRNEKPQEPYVKWMKEQGCWNDEMENLPENQYDKIIKEKYGHKSKNQT